MGTVAGEGSDAVYSQRAGVVLREVAGEHLLVPIRRDAADLQAIFALNGIGLFIWGLLDGQRTFGGLLEAILDRFEVGAEEAEADLRAFLERLSGAGVVDRVKP